MENEGNADNPRSVIRGLNIEPLRLGIDSLYLLIEYPDIDVYRRWKAAIAHVPKKRLYRGHPHEDFVIKNGMLGYGLSMWEGDARILLTDQVDETLRSTKRAGEGMGALLQLGPKWLTQYADIDCPDDFREAIYIQFRRFGIEDPEEYPIRINRIDIALDIFGLATSELDFSEWKNGWVGRSGAISSWAEDGNLTGIKIGSPKGSVYFKLYDKVLQSKSDSDLGFWITAWNWIEFASKIDIENACIPFEIARAEWSIRPYNAKFENFKYLEDYTFEGLQEIANYVLKKWGRLCTISGNTNRAQWHTHPLWQKIQEFMQESWHLATADIATRQYNLTPDISPKFKSSFRGSLASLRARVGLHLGYDHPASTEETLEYIHKQTKDADTLAQEKFEIILRLSGRGKKAG
ncbi:MAG: hypothetical protein H6670_08325 [Anaerolineaceae bacterium]|nr:hypothetical protein [Anaerolineaceae bacterium]